MAEISKDFADRAIERYRKGSKSPAPEPTDTDGDEDEEKPDSDAEKSDAELGRALASAIRKGNFAAITAAIRAICD